MSETTANGILFNGLDGSNPLAFLAALGTLRTLTLALPNESVKMGWCKDDGAWRPRVWCSLSGDSSALIATIQGELSKAAERASFAIGDNLNLPAGEFQTQLRNAVTNPEALKTSRARINSDFLAAFGSDVITDDNGIIQDTALRTMSGAGHQHFLKFFRELIAQTDADHLRRSLLLKWDYADEGRGLNLRWDPLDDRRYAMRWDDPSGDPVKTMRGANRLAIEALPLLPTMPTKHRLATTAFEGKGARDTFFTWPVWDGGLTTMVVTSLLARVRALRDCPQHRDAVGVTGLYTSARITTGKFRNFTPGRPV